uniref:START domain-containing protein n=1 Tax=Daucus carota subsp. sativus TaxID=79200 RepID=A0A166IVT0_DAUCS
MAKNEHYPTIIDEMSSNEKHSEIDIGRSGEKALLQSTVGLVEADKAFIVERAIAAMDELIMMAQAGEPLWIPIIHSGIECLNKDEYLSSFPNRIELKPVKTKSEASRESVVIFMNPTKLVEILMDVEQWSTVFSGIVSRASIIDVLSTGMAGNYNEALQVLSKRMMLSYCNSFGVSAAHTCNTLCGDGATKAKIMAKKNTDDPGMPYGTIVSVASSFWIQFSPEKVFDFLNDETSRNKWDMIASTGQVYEIMRISNGCDPSSCISLLNLHNSRESNTHILKETRVDSTASYVIYTSVDTTPLNVVLSGGDPTYVALLPSGFVIHPDGPRHNVGGIIEVGSGGSLLTVAFQIMVHSALPEDLTCERVAIVNTLTQSVVERIQNALVSSLSI